MPYNWAKSHLNNAIASRNSDSEMGEAPYVICLMPLKSRFSMPGICMTNMIIAGTINTTSTGFCSISSRNFMGSKVSWIMICIPLANPESKYPAPPIWNSGAIPMPAEPTLGRQAAVMLPSIIVLIRLYCESTTPLGLPVVPLVYNCSNGVSRSNSM